MKTLNQYIIERYFSTKPTKMTLETNEDLFDYIVKRYNLSSIRDCIDAKKCPKNLNLKLIVISKLNYNKPLFYKFKCESIDISNWNITEIGNFMFSRCSNLTNFIIPETVTKIKTQAFSKCASLEEITIPNKVQRIYYEAFEDCTSLKKIFIPASVTQIDNRAFSGCGRLSEITTPKGNAEKLKSILFSGYRYLIKEV